MKSQFLWLAILASFLVAGCAGIDSRRSYDTKADFASFKTYDWVPGVQQSFSQPRFGDFIIEVGDKIMESKGFTKTSDQPDFLIDIPATNRHKEVYTSIYGGRIEVFEGKLAIFILDGTSRDIIWEGAATISLKEMDTPEKVEERINISTYKLLKEFPPEQ